MAKEPERTGKVSNWESDALLRIQKRIRGVSKKFAKDEARMFKELAWLAMLEDYVRMCQKLKAEGR